MDKRGHVDRVYANATLRIIPFLCLCYLVAMIDRLNVGFAKLQFLDELHLTELQFGIAASCFYAGYILFEIPSNLMMFKLGIGLTLLRIMAFWGVTTVLLGFAYSAMHLYLLRFMIGLAEAGFVPAVLLYLTYWFPDRLRARMTSLFLATVPAAGILGGPLAGWIMTEMDGAYGLSGWRWLFLIEGLPAVLLGIFAYYYLPTGPQAARWLSAEERAVITQDVEDGRPRWAGQPKTFAKALVNRRVWALALVYFLFYCLQNTLLVWTPTLLRNVGGIGLMTVGWIGAAISVVAVMGLLYLSARSDRMNERRWHLIGCGVVSSLCFLLLPMAATSLVGTAVLLAIASVTVFTFLALFWTIPTTYLQGGAAASGLALINSVGAVGGVLTPIFIGFMRDLTGSFYGALAALAGGLLLGMPILYACTRPETPGLPLFPATRVDVAGPG